jgi:hypothetical protein
MVFVSKLEISPACGSIDIDKEMELIEIKYKDGSKLKYKLIQFRHVKRIVYNE